MAVAAAGYEEYIPLMLSFRRLALPASILALAAAQAAAGQRAAIAGPVQVEVLRVIDGDTFLAEAHVWPGHDVTVRIRIRGVDAPEIRSRCRPEKAAALRAREALAHLLRSGHASISAISGGKYYGRVLADVRTSEGIDVGPYMIGAALARAYAGGPRSASAC